MADKTDNELLLDSVRAVEVADAALAEADQAMAKHAAAETKYQARIKDAVDELVKHERLDPSNAVKLAELLKDPVEALNTLIKAADPTVTAKPRRMGAAAPAAPAGVQQQKQAASGASTATEPQGSFNRIVTDARRPVGESEADQQFARHFLGR